MQRHRQIAKGRGHRALEVGISAFAEGHHRRALGSFDQAMSWGLEHGDSDLWDRALCNRCAVEIELGELGDSLSELRQIVLRSSDPENAFIAAYTVARAYEVSKDHRRAMFYARIARDRCHRVENQEWLGACYNQMGNLLLGQSQWEEACSEFEHALPLMRAPTAARALVLDNLGYSRILQGRYDEGFRLIFEGLRSLVRLGRAAESSQVFPRLSLCYAYIDVGKLRGALRHGLRALELAIQADDDDSIKNAHYLLGETYHQLGHNDVARQYFTRLQQRYYPEALHVPELLMNIDVRPLLNLKA